ncbi:hypothetical protein Tco_0025892 [Tanacetum coccineum]
MIRICDMTYFQDYEWYEGLEDGDLKDEALKEKSILNYHKLDYKLMTMLQEYWWGKKEEEESRMTNDDAIQGDQEWFDECEPMKDDVDIGDLDDYLITNDAPYFVDEEKERSKEKSDASLYTTKFLVPSDKDKIGAVTNLSFKVSNAFSLASYHSNLVDFFVRDVSIEDIFKNS